MALVIPIPTPEWPRRQAWRYDSTKPLPGQVRAAFLLVGDILAMASNANTDVDKLISFGKMALEQGWYDQAREHFEQVLALDSSNREALKGLARLNEILSRREAAAVEPTRGEPVEPLRKVARKTKRQWWIWVLVAIACLLAPLMCCLAVWVLTPSPKRVTEMRPTEITATPSLAKPVETPINVFSLRESVVVDDIEVAISEYEVLSSFYATAWDGTLVEVKPPEGAKFLLIHVYTKNVGKVAHSLPRSMSFSLIYEGTKMYYSSEMPEDRQKYSVGIFGATVYPGGSKEGWICYEIPASADPAEMEIHFKGRIWRLTPQTDLPTLVPFPTVTPTVTEEAVMGEFVVYEDVKITVIEYEFTDSYVNTNGREEKPEEGAKFLWLYVRSENVGEVAQDLPSPSQFVLLYKDTKINRKLLMWEDPQGYTRYQGEKVYPGISREGWILYEIPVGADPAEIMVRFTTGKEYHIWRLEAE